MKIIKRNGSEAVFDISKIIAAVTKANNVVASNQRLTKEQITAIADDVAQECQSRNHAMNVEEIRIWWKTPSCRPKRMRWPANISPTAMCRA